MPLEKLPVITQGQVDRGKNDQLQSFAGAVGLVGLISAVNYRFNAPGGSKVQKGIQIVFTGVEAKPTASGRAALRFPLASVFAAALPSPIGYVPGEWYGLHPAVVRRTLGFGAGKKPIIFEPSADRIAVFQAQDAANQIERRLLSSGNVEANPFSGKITRLLPGRVAITPEELAFLEALPPGVASVQEILPELRQRQADFLPATTLPQATPLDTAPRVPSHPLITPLGSRLFHLSRSVAMGSMQPERIKPVNAKALANEAAAEGIRKALVKERADP